MNLSLSLDCSTLDLSNESSLYESPTSSQEDEPVDSKILSTCPKKASNLSRGRRKPYQSGFPASSDRSCQKSREAPTSLLTLSDIQLPLADYEYWMSIRRTDSISEAQALFPKSTLPPGGEIPPIPRIEDFVCERGPREPSSLHLQPASMALDENPVAGSDKPSLKEKSSPYLLGWQDNINYYSPSESVSSSLSSSTSAFEMKKSQRTSFPIVECFSSRMNSVDPGKASAFGTKHLSSIESMVSFPLSEMKEPVKNFLETVNLDTAALFVNQVISSENTAENQSLKPMGIENKLADDQSIQAGLFHPGNVSFKPERLAKQKDDKENQIFFFDFPKRDLLNNASRGKEGG